MNPKIRMCLMIALLVLTASAASAQSGGGSHPPPSGSGGSAGGPGMSGQAVNAGVPPQGDNGGINISRPPGGGIPTRPSLNGDHLSSIQGGGNFTPPSGDNSASSRFGQRGSGSIQLPSGSQPFSRGSFGSSTAQTYDQFWADYDAAVDANAQTYYNTVTASADYLLQTYEEAVNDSTQSVDYYLAYAQQYASYCAAYPWDCYSYAYDSASDSYVYVGDASSQPVSTTTIGNVATTATFPVQAAPVPSAEAYQALVVFANDQLGAVVEPLYAGVATDSIQSVMAYLPPEIQAYALKAMSISGASYWGLLNGGAAGIEVGDCSSGNCTVSADTLSLQLSSASAGLYGINASASMPADAGGALALITQIYPKLSGLSFAQITDIESGFAFTASTASLGYDPATRQPVSVAKVVYAGVVSVNGKPFVYALVALGQGYVNVVTQ